MSPRTKLSKEERVQELAKVFLTRAAVVGDHYVEWRGGFYTWTGTHYREIDERAMRAKVGMFVEAYVEDIMSAPDVPNVGRSLVTDVLDAISRRINQPNDREAPFALNAAGPQGRCVTFTNGVLNLDRWLKGESDPFTAAHDKNWFSLVCLPFNFDSEAICPKFDTFLEQTFEADQECISFIREWFGYNCVADYSFQHFLILTGEGQVGKSTLLHVLQGLLGKENVSSVPYQLFASRFSLATTIGKLANIAGEIDGAGPMAENTIKEYTGGGTLYVDVKGKPAVNLKPTARLTFACNRVPNFFDKSRGMRRRAIILPFNRIVPESEKNVHLHEELEQELPGVFNRALDGLRALYDRGMFHIPKRCEAAVEAHVLESNPALQFLADYTELDGEGETSADALWDAYKFWYQHSGPFEDKLRNKAEFGKDVAKFWRGKVERKQLRRSDKRGYYYVGLRYMGADGMEQAA